MYGTSAQHPARRRSTLLSPAFSVGIKYSCDATATASSEHFQSTFPGDRRLEPLSACRDVLSSPESGRSSPGDASAVREPVPQGKERASSGAEGCTPIRTGATTARTRRSRRPARVLRQGRSSRSRVPPRTCRSAPGGSGAPARRRDQSRWSP